MGLTGAVGDARQQQVDSEVAVTSPSGALSLPRERLTLRDGVTALVVLAAYVFLEWLSFIHEHKGVPITPWNPGLGLVFAMMVLSGPHYALVLFVGAVIAEIAVLRSSLEWPIMLGVSLIIAGGYGLVAVVARKKLRLDVGLNRLHDVFALLLAGVAGTALVALALSLLMLADAQMDVGDVLTAAWPLLIGDIIGIAVVTPLVLRLALSEQPLAARLTPVVILELLLYVAVVVVALWVIVGATATHGFKLFYLLFLPVVVAAVRHGLDGACIGLGLTQLGLVGLLHRYGYDASAFTEFQMMMLVMSATGLIVGVVVTERQHAVETVRDVEAQLRAKEAEAAHAARLNLVSGTAAALAHEINQPMTAARALARSAQHLMSGEKADLARASENLATAIAQIDHAGGVVRRMREFLRRGRPHLSTIDVAGMLADALALARLESELYHVTLDVAPDLPAAHGDRVQLQQVVLNLVRNAAQAIASADVPDGHIRVSASYFEDPARIEFAVADNGPGLDSAMAARLFEPLATSKSEGFGLGLTICASIVEAHGGRLWLASREAGATEFRFTLPLEQG